jgi:heptosyltransferase I
MRLAIVKLSALGDIVHAMVVLQFIKKYNQEILIDWFVEESYKELLEFNPDVNKVHLLNIKQAKKKKSMFILNKEFKKIRKLEPYDLVIDMQGLIKSGIISKLIPSKKTVGFDKFSAKERLASIFYNNTFKCSYDTNVIDRNLMLIEYALGAVFDIKQIHNKDPFLYSSKQAFNIQSTESKKSILIIPGASHSSKRYPLSKLGELTKLIDANFYLVWGSLEEKMLTKKIQEISPNIHIFNKLSIESLVALIDEVDLVIGPDTGPTHIAWALNVPSITLFGPTPGYRNTYQTKINKVIESKSKVNPSKINKSDFSIKDIEVNDIVKISHQLLKAIE